MTRLRRLALTMVAGSILAGCSVADNAGVAVPTLTLPNVVGSWNLTTLEFVSIANPSLKAEEVTSSAPATLVLTATAFSISGGGATFFSGTYTETATTLTVNGTDSGGHAEMPVFALALNGTTLSLTGATSTHDFGSGSVPATLNLIGTKQ